MGVDLSAQAAALWQALLLGAALALLYDGLRALRLRRRADRPFTGALDALYALLVFFSLLSFALRVGRGELRLYTLLAVSLGAAFSFALLSPLLRPLWAFWAAVLFDLARLFRLPFRLAKKYYGKLHKLFKKHFLFSRRAFIIEHYKWSARRARRRAERKEGLRRDKRKNRPVWQKQRTGGKASSARPAAPRRRAGAESPEKDR